MKGEEHADVVTWDNVMSNIEDAEHLTEGDATEHLKGEDTTGEETLLLVDRLDTEVRNVVDVGSWLAS